ncbi:hypothetical protein T265_07093 [Opisthorchis viverrini]|uniref:Uncharacterized protein n=1 Tax=Opisthorchis viverrini TaxID=6198 RepID=A0A074ZDW3_OPIVI|nr:hypothetical protein T265_07093 [Opisthorchis viverrini]KER25471.1 hypothetical protein T265_07093 [Opisthorchis viverrini]
MQSVKDPNKPSSPGTSLEEQSITSIGSFGCQYKESAGLFDLTTEEPIAVLITSWEAAPEHSDVDWCGTRASARCCAEVRRRLSSDWLMWFNLSYNHIRDNLSMDMVLTSSRPVCPAVAGLPYLAFNSIHYQELGFCRLRLVSVPSESLEDVKFTKL